MRVFYQKSDDEFVLSEIKEVLKLRPSYGYRRITAIINRRRKLEFKSRINKKRVLRIMQINGLTLQRTSHPRDHQPTGKVMTLFSNTRWCSDAFEIRCFDRSKVFVAFVLDCHDREAISFVASTEPLTQVNIQSQMVISVEKRFNSLQAPREIQWLSDRGSIYRATETILTAKNLNLNSCFTSIYILKSHGMKDKLCENNQT